MNKKQLLIRAGELFASLPREKIGFFPTPLHKLNKISESYDIEVWIKRDDLTGPSIFGGNKTRKLEFLLAEARQQGADYIITYGATQSNHAMQTATACCKLGLKAILYLVAVIEPDKERLLGNLLIDRIMDAEVHIESKSVDDTGEAVERLHRAAARRMQELEAEGHRCYEIPVGGANATGSLGYAQAMLELAGQIEQEPGLDGFDYIYHAIGSGGTLAGLLAGRELLSEDYTLVPVDVGLAKPDYQEKIALWAEQTLGMLGIERAIAEDSFLIDYSHSGPGYEIPSPESSLALKTLAREEGILVGPVYTAKALAALLADLQSGKIEKGSRVLFWHTGGGSELFAEAEIVGEDIFK